jgi:hypothetical protein
LSRHLGGDHTENGHAANGAVLACNLNPIATLKSLIPQKSSRGIQRVGSVTACQKRSVVEPGIISRNRQNTGACRI